MHTRIAQLRTKLNLSQNKFGEVLGVSRDVIANVEGNRREIPSYLVKLICLTFDVNENWLLNGEGSMFHQDVTEEKLENDILSTFSTLTFEQKKKLSEFLQTFATENK